MSSRRTSVALYCGASASIDPGVGGKVGHRWRMVSGSGSDPVDGTRPTRAGSGPAMPERGPGDRPAEYNFNDT